MDRLALIERDLKKMIESNLERTGILHRIYSRIKSESSINEKIIRKGYFRNGKKIQDLIGIRILTYFGEDIDVLVNYFSSHLDLIHMEYDSPDVNEFNPVRINLVCRLQGEHAETFNRFQKQHRHWEEHLDPTFEIQIRTTFSEGWHEVEHHMRYKCKNEWDEMENESRLLNGIYAMLDTSDRTLNQLFEEMAYKHYKNRNWTGMLRNKFRLRFSMETLLPELSVLFNRDKEIAKCFLKVNRNQVLGGLLKSGIQMPISFNNLIFFANYLLVGNDKILEQTPSALLTAFNKSYTIEPAYEIEYSDSMDIGVPLKYRS